MDFLDRKAQIKDEHGIVPGNIGIVTQHSHIVWRHTKTRCAIKFCNLAASIWVLVDEQVMILQSGIPMGENELMLRINVDDPTHQAVVMFRNRWHFGVKNVDGHELGPTFIGVEDAVSYQPAAVKPPLVKLNRTNLLENEMIGGERVTVVGGIDSARTSKPDECRHKEYEKAEPKAVGYTDVWKWGEVERVHRLLVLLGHSEQSDNSGARW
jgi:hypothetical protein